MKTLTREERFAREYALKYVKECIWKKRGAFKNHKKSAKDFANSLAEEPHFQYMAQEKARDVDKDFEEVKRRIGRTYSQ